MFHMLKRRLYFVVARYFRFWARLKLRRWQPRIIVVTGSAGKTTLLHLIEAQLGSEAHYSHHANSAYGIPMDILGLIGIYKSRFDWLRVLLQAPIAAFTKPYKEKLYVAEVDSDRPHEGRFLASLLHPHITLWVSSLHTHTAQFDELVRSGEFNRPEEAVAHEYGDLLAKTQELVIVNGDTPLMVEQTKRTKAKVVTIHANTLKTYELAAGHTIFGFKDKQYRVSAPQPRSVYYQVAMVDALLDYLQRQPDYSFRQFTPPPGRSTVFEGIHQTQLIDSTYNNSNVDSLAGVVEMFETYPAKTKWLVLSDLIEQGQDNEREHVKIAKVLDGTHFQKILLEGPRIKEFTAPHLSEALRGRTDVQVFDKPTEVLSYIQEHLQGGETICFKGVRFMEGVIEKLLAHPTDAERLVRREPMWQKWRVKWGFKA